jgi:hypothetical protein
LKKDQKIYPGRLQQYIYLLIRGNVEVYTVEPSQPYDASIPAGSNDGTYDQFRYREASRLWFRYRGHQDRSSQAMRKGQVKRT